MDFSHKLPAHLGGWPCRIVRQISSWHADDGHPETVKQLALVEYEFAPGSGDIHDTRRLYVVADELERIMPAEPTTPYVEGADGRVYRRLPGTNPGTGEALWKSSSGPVLTWAELSQAWEDQQKTQPVVPLAPVQPVQLPFEITNADSDAVAVDADRRKVRFDLAGNWTWSDPDEAEQIAWALLSAVRQVRGYWVKGHTPVTVGNLTDSTQATPVLRKLCDGCDTQALCLADQKCRIGRVK